MHFMHTYIGTFRNCFYCCAHRVYHTTFCTCIIYTCTQDLQECSVNNWTKYKMEDCSEDGALEIATKTWNRAVNSAAKIAYREGREDGSESVFQDGFDKGYHLGFKTALTLGKYKGLATSLPSDIQHPPEILDILQKTRRGECYACIEERNNTKESKDFDKRPIDKVIECQEKHSAVIINKLHDYFEPLLKSQNICIDLKNL